MTSDDSISLSTPGMLVAQMSKSPSTEFTGENSASLVSEESRSYWIIQESVFAELSSEEKECILNIPAAKNLDDLRMFARYAVTVVMVVRFYVWFLVYIFLMTSIFTYAKLMSFELALQ